VTTASPGPGPWVETWLSPPRFARYLQAAGGDRARALALYEWNAGLGAAMLHDLAHLEVALRNAYDRAGSAAWSGPGHWLVQGGTTLFAPLLRTKRTGGGRRRIDVNKKQRELLEAAIRAAGGPAAPPGKVVAELMFAFWRYLTSSAHEKTVRVPFLFRAFPPGTARVDVDAKLGRLHELRNRVAHHEPLLGLNVATLHRDLLALATALSAELRTHIDATTAVPSLLTQRP
jgi:hypothetical protein